MIRIRQTLQELYPVLGWSIISELCLVSLIVRSGLYVLSSHKGKIKLLFLGLISLDEIVLPCMTLSTCL